ncbi:tetratricopeptide repeat protein, partial [bacterium]|nr:tetratricopeptide repeat protein [bacterium]
THNDLGLAYKQAGYYDRAARAYRRAIELDAGYPDPLRNLGVIYAYHRVDFPQAIDLWEQYMSLCPDDADGEMIRAEIQRVKFLLADDKSSNLRPSGKEFADDEHTR